SGVLLETLRFVPLGALLAALLARVRRGLLLSWAAALALGAVVLGLPLRAAPGPIDLALPWLGATIGVVAVALWNARAHTRRRAFLWTAVLVAAGAAATGALLAMTVERQPLTLTPAPHTPEDKRRVYRLLKGKNPRKVPAGETRTLELAAA